MPLSLGWVVILHQLLLAAMILKLQVGSLLKIDLLS